MYIKKATLDNFGKFHQRTIHFTPGLNVVYGENESGKSTLHSFLVGMLFGMEKQRGRAANQGDYQKYEPWNAASYYTGSLEFSVSDKNFTIERNFYHKEKTVRLYNQQDGEELSVEHGDLEMLLGGISRRFYENTCCISQAAVITKEDFAREMQQQLANQIYGGETSVDVAQAEKLLEGKRKQAEQKVKAIRQQKQQRQERLEWEQELLLREVEALKEKMEAAADKAANAEPAEFQEQQTEDAEKESVLWNIPVIGWLLRLIRFIWRKMTGRKSQEPAVQACDADYDKEPDRESDENYDKESDQRLAEHYDKAARQVLSEQLEEKQMRLHNIREEIEETSGIEAAEREVVNELKSIQLAVETIRYVAGETYQNSRDDIQASVSEIFSGITDGKYDKVELPENGQLVIYRNELQSGYGNRQSDSMQSGIGQSDSMQSGIGQLGSRLALEPWQLSRGAMEQLYFALRLGVGRSLMQEEQLPLLLDEPFCSYDDLRTKRTLQWLAEQPEQQILFTCQKREIELLEELGIWYNKIIL